ncbi:multifunctional 2',3'-cyclic-nucleotide 2'-phosphodiesterase/5'-nucleotidase/3'-nucleotidase [Philodulcilactobacillus myokoensis]|uniref:Multifunctional 2',3'-cyclic-nucleotide 2'-phosphodiesterase/5'-nucleotidase/3'-nucleotidase n=1 Tax=Philodulcilactobacillus myokoensis TaxID=2929573 RepID=A0A9W6B1D1_9LACO|nr:5'-nucleotidase C-terminal domain-containing protein [Philodulcilactobacillus myokoensis]GLB46710.1 multifunctional 2',3'-cyclic-nucleotide 2'-phosphodiesterase/5'-nucleotidase/3'-nucleotidase [Philodulcilactobacillus myokoensis]
MDEKIAILHTNDLHSHFENWPKIRRYLVHQKAVLEKQGYFVLTVDDGDAIDHFHPLTDATAGQANVKLLNQVHYDAATIGNNEGLTNTHNQLNHLYDHANFNIILDNLIDKTTNQKPKWAIPSKTIETPNHTRIMILGLTVPYATYRLLGWDPMTPKQVMPKLAKKIDGKADVTILLSHLGIFTDRKIAKHNSLFDVIIGGHTHHLLVHGEEINRTMLAAAQKYGHYVGCVKLTLKHHHVESREASVVKTSDLPEQSGDKTEINHYIELGNHLLANQKIAYLPTELKANLLKRNQMINIGLKALSAKAHTDAAVINSGLFLRNLPAGIINMNYLHQLLPHNMHVVRTTLTGYNLNRLVQEMEKNKRFLVKFQQKGMGFRGKYFGKLNYLGIKYDDKKQRTIFNGRPVENDKTYSIALLDHYIYIPFFPTVQIAGDNHIFYDQNLREVFADYLGKAYPLNK